MARFYADENFPRRTTARLRQLKHDVVTAHEAGRANRQIPDPEVVADARALGRAVLTMNRDDYHAIHARSPDHAGIVTCTRDDNFEALADRIDLAVGRLPDLRGQLIRVLRGTT